MDQVIDFIRDFHPSQLGLGLWEILVAYFAIIGGIILINWLVSFFSAPTANVIRTVFKWTLTTLAFGFILFILLNAVLTGDYGNVFISLILVVALRIDHWYKLYDNFVDKIIKRNN